MRKANWNTLFAAIAIDLLAVALLLSTLPRPAAMDIGYVQMGGKGDSMYPTIKEGQLITVQMPVKIESIEVGDIIVYGSIAVMAYVPYPETLWICHRVTEKYQKDGQWWFRTKGDNNSEIDPWEVPYYWVTGLVVDIAQPKSLPSSQAPSSEPTQPQPVAPRYPSIELEVALPIAGGLTLIAMMVALTHLRHRKQLTMLRKTNIHSCYTCIHYRKRYLQRLVVINGRQRIQRTPDFSRGACQYLNCMIPDFPRRECEHYRAKRPAGWG
jgi:signal peptidase I